MHIWTTGERQQIAHKFNLIGLFEKKERKIIHYCETSFYFEICYFSLMTTMPYLMNIIIMNIYILNNFEW